MSLLKFVEKIVQVLKRNPEYRFKVELNNRELMGIIVPRFAQIIRGFFKKLFLKKANGFTFIGKNTRLEHSYNIQAGNSLILEDFVHINALSKEGISFGNNVTVGKYSSLVCSGVIANKGVGIKIGNNSAIGAHSFLGGQGGITIGENVIMGPGVRIFSENHNCNDINIPIRMQGEERKGVIIEDDCWIGAGATILDGVIIGKGCVIAAGAIVTKNISQYSIAAGIPAKIIKQRK